MAEYSARAAERYGRVAGGWTPLNEPLINADHSGQRGVWPPHLRGDIGYDRVLVAIAEGVSASVAAIRAVDVRARIVAVEPAEIMSTFEPELEELVNRRWQALFLPIDLVMGRVDESHHFWPRLTANGVSPERLERLVSNAQRPDVVGVNFYPGWSARRFITFRGGLRQRIRPGTGADLVTALAAFHHHTGVPVMVTETSDNGSHEHRGAWMADSTSAVLAARSAGLPVVGYTWFPVFSLIDWRWRRGPYERVAYWRHMGLWDLDEETQRHRTPLVDQFAALVAESSAEDAVA